MKKIILLFTTTMFTVLACSQPYSNAQPIGAGGGGSFSKIIINPISGEYWAANDMGGVFKSTDKGDTWQYLSENFHGFSIYDIEFDPIDPNTVYALHNNGVEKTSDGGLTWNMITAPHPENATSTVPHIGNSFNLGETFKRLELLKIDPQNTSIIYAGGHYITPYTGNIDPRKFYIYKSIDGGASWNNIPSGAIYSPPGNSFFTGTIHTLELNNTNTNILYAAGYYGFYKSYDGGATWANFSNGLPYEALPKARSIAEMINGDPPDKYKGVMLIDLIKHPTDSNTFFTLTASHGVYKTTDGGQNWLSINGTGTNQIDLLPYDSLAVYDDYHHGALNKTLMMDPANPDRFVLGTVTGATTANVLYETTDGGVNWHPLLRQYPSYPAATINENSPFYSLRDSAFASCHMNDCGGPTYSLAIDPLSPDTILGTGAINIEKLVVDPAGDSLLSRDLFYKGLYVITPFSLGPSIASLNNGQSIYIAGMDISIHKTSNGGTTWQSMMTSSMVDYNGERQWIHARSIRAIPTSPPTLFMGCSQSVLEGAVYKSSDDGNSWSRLINGLPMPPSTGQGACLQVQPSSNYINDSTVYAVYDHAGVFKSTNGGASFSAINTGLPDSSILSFENKAQPLAIHPDSTNVLFLTTTFPTKTLYKSNNGGANWNVISAIDSIGYVMGGTTVTTDFLGNTIILVSGEYGIIRSANNGTTWDLVASVFDLVLPSQINEQWVQELPFTKVVVNPTNRQNLFFTIATYGTTERLSIHGIYASDDAGATWYKMFNTPYQGGNIIVSDDGLSILSFSGGMDVWKHNLSGTSSKQNSGFIIFPNPCADVVNILLTKELAGVKSFVVIDCVGKIVKEYPVVENQKIFQINTSNFSNGFYTVNVLLLNGQVYTEKLIVSHF